MRTSKEPSTQSISLAEAEGSNRMGEPFIVKVKQDYQDAVIRFKHHFDIEEAPKLIFANMRGLIQTWMQFTPPSKKIMGLKAIRADFHKVFVDRQWFAKNFVSRRGPEEQTRIRRYFREANFDALKQIEQDGGLFQTLKFKPFSKSDIHRNGRGRMMNNHQNIMVTNPEQLDAYRKKKEDKVGRLKGSMGKALEYFGGRMPGWIKKNSEGDYKDYTGAENVKGASATSFVPYGQQVAQRDDTIRRVYQAQTNKILGSLKHSMNESLQKYYKKR